MFYRLVGNSVNMTTYVEAVNRTQDSLVLGCKIDEEYEELPYVYTYDESAGNPLFDFFGGDSIMSLKMYNLLKECGVNNIQALPLKFIDKNTNEERDDYIVFNIIGLVRGTKFIPLDKLDLSAGKPLRNLIIDSEKVNGLKVFRIAESLSEILVAEDVAKKLEEGNLLGFTLTPASAE